MPIASEDSLVKLIESYKPKSQEDLYNLVDFFELKSATVDGVETKFEFTQQHQKVVFEKVYEALTICRQAIEIVSPKEIDCFQLIFQSHYVNFVSLVDPVSYTKLLEALSERLMTARSNSKSCCDLLEKINLKLKTLPFDKNIARIISDINLYLQKQHQFKIDAEIKDEIENIRAQFSIIKKGQFKDSEKQEAIAKLNTMKNSGLKSSINIDLVDLCLAKIYLHETKELSSLDFKRKNDIPRLLQPSLKKQNPESLLEYANYLMKMKNFHSTSKTKTTALEYAFLAYSNSINAEKNPDIFPHLEEMNFAEGLKTIIKLYKESSGLFNNVERKILGKLFEFIIQDPPSYIVERVSEEAFIRFLDKLNTMLHGICGNLLRQNWFKVIKFTTEILRGNFDNQNLLCKKNLIKAAEPLEVKSDDNSEDRDWEFVNYEHASNTPYPSMVSASSPSFIPFHSEAYVQPSAPPMSMMTPVCESSDQSLSIPPAPAASVSAQPVQHSEVKPQGFRTGNNSPRLFAPPSVPGSMLVNNPPESESGKKLIKKNQDGRNKTVIMLGA